MLGATLRLEVTLRLGYPPVRGYPLIFPRDLVWLEFGERILGFPGATLRLGYPLVRGYPLFLRDLFPPHARPRGPYITELGQYIQCTAMHLGDSVVAVNPLQGAGCGFLVDFSKKALNSSPGKILELPISVFFSCISPTRHPSAVH